ncbi:MAG: DUF3795 domain-containing protein [Candidatus Pacebacteria bacterium]|nr:DUF3795 domain-containing protein [Candidatus Paceibacterota bacterium]
MNQELKIGVCGIVCGKCPEYISNRCKGCSSKIPADICPLPTCAESKRIKICFNCFEFPCEKNYKGGPIVSALLDHWKKQKQGK